MKPYRETHEQVGLIEAPIERVWALHTDVDAMRTLSDRVLAMDLVSGRMGEVGCKVTTTLRAPNGRLGTADSEVIEAEHGRRIATRAVVREAPKVILYSTWEFGREGNRTRVTLTATAETKPIPGLVRLVLRLTRAKRARDAAALFAQEIADESAYHARHGDSPQAH
jgi:ligand-binding SRPBCC domain-containing protein